MLQVKLPYYPKVVATMRETRFGAKEISVPEIYDQPVANKVIMRVDTLDCLVPILGKECFICRELIYTILAGDSDIYNVSDVFASFYRKYPTMTAYVNDKYHFGDSTIPIVERTILPLRELVNKYSKEVFEKLDNSGGKFLVQTHDYLYFAFNKGARLPDMEGATIIC